MPVENRIGAFALSRLSDCALATLQQDVNEEIRRREVQKQRAREDWVSNKVGEFCLRGGSYMKMDTTVVVAVRHNGSVKVAKTTPVRNDKFDLNTGIAVAFAKACGDPIPNYI